MVSAFSVMNLPPLSGKVSACQSFHVLAGIVNPILSKGMGLEARDLFEDFGIGFQVQFSFASSTNPGAG